MGKPDFSRRDFLAQSLFVGGGALVLTSCTSSPPGGSGGGKVGAGGLPPIEGPTIITDPAKFPKTFAESPAFAGMVKAGRLPPVAQRIGQDPLVVQPLREIGTYGGEIRRGYLGVTDFQNANRFCSGPDNLLYWDYQRKTVIPNIARAFELSDGDKVLTIQLRRGMKWSDGHPFTADDIIFWREDISLDSDLSLGSPSLRINGEEVKVEKVDDHTVRYISPVPNPLLPQLLAGWTDIGGHAQWGAQGGGGFAPKHYLSKFHPKYTSKSEVEKLAAAAGVKSWPAFFLRMNDWSLNTELPMLTPWKTTRAINSSPWTLEANPYSIWVDAKGNQLPYIPKITMREAGGPQVLTLRAVSGEYDFLDRKLSLSSMSVLLKNQKRGDYTIHRTPSTTVIDLMLRLNLAYKKDKVIGDLLRDVDFRRALSLGLDRNQFNQTFLLGTGVPTAVTPHESSPFFLGPEWRTKWATYDVARANQLLDKIGLTKKDAAGYRLRPDGKGRIKLDHMGGPGFVDYTAVGEMIKRQWKAIGIDVVNRVVAGGLGVQDIFANQVVLQVNAMAADDPLIKPDQLLPTNNVQGVIGIPYAKWFDTGGKKGEEPPESLRLLREAMELRRKGLTAPEPERLAIGKRIYQMHADQVWSIGLAGFGMSVYGFYLAKNRLGNVPARVVSDEFVKSPTNALPMTFYYKK
ncbi:MAG TPA: ABC transporter substrate-binding protein [Streptosporangiaceae bacterium]|nr:ABC transporter substrate-binding protein [Streptosporangiaceae bacterium]